MTASSSSSVSPLHLIFKPAAHLISSPGQPLASSSTVPFFATLADSSCKALSVVSMTSLQDSATTIHTLIFSSSEVCAFLTVFISNTTIILSEDCVILTYQNSQYESHVSASADVLSV
ncbi:hypothetical protein BDBG_00698 [Blastomyces gilchristii SLH14081]|uniref:Uncharacterized protein n=1 Tax=Blastomyces gilchristii (strain SLH14081) TaxID=559298 RepID=A0A179U9U3_BLAGS|nr:uncharacterized protein BDBG_00698 [Blastomyces gilchristii SLH14081]OAT04069.1 hypothetical protein BDBG_00698 [Blastomyces gilchristii SLH14081]